jgi:Domain of unknown function (DUF4381)
MNPAAAPTREAMQGLILPPPVSFWPATPAWFVLLVVLAALLLWVAWRGWRRWRADAYRREALRAVEAAQQPAEIAAILKRTALAAWPRSEVAALSGPDWTTFLQRTAPGAKLDATAARRLASLAYAPVSLDARDDAARWIRFHDARA